MRLCTAAQMRSIDSRAIEDFGIPSVLLMENAGRAVAERAAALLREGTDRGVVVVCGKGNNGGDGFVAARHLHARGIPVRCFLAGDPAEMKGDARLNYDLAMRLGILVDPSEALPAEGWRAGLVIDALLGTGFTGEPRGVVRNAILAVNRSSVPVLAVDVPSGLDADTGQASEACVRASETVTFALPKLGLAAFPGRELAGDVTVANISLPPSLLEEPALRAEWVTSERAAPLWPSRDPMAHKGRGGKLLVLAGSVGMTGAAALTCDSALRAGTGLVTLGTPQSLHDILEVKLTEAMTFPLPETEQRALAPEGLPEVRRRLESADALAVGPGLGRDLRTGELLRGILSNCPVPVVVDADGLYLLSPADGETFPERCVITPHPGELARLLGTDLDFLQSNRMESVRKAAERFRCVVILKGPATLIAAPDGRLGVNASGGPALATGGSGDVLTGIVASCLARGLEPYEAAVAATFLHGVAGEVAGERQGAPGTVASDVVAGVPEALRRLRIGEIPPPCRMI